MYWSSWTEVAQVCFMLSVIAIILAIIITIIEWRNGVPLAAAFKYSKLETDVDVLARIGFICFIIYGGLTLIIPRTPLASYHIGSPFEKAEYTAYYYALYEPYQSDSVKRYKLVTKIVRDEDGHRITEAYWPNGGQLYLSGDELLGYLEPVNAQDQDGESWTIQLLDEPAPIPEQQ